MILGVAQVVVNVADIERETDRLTHQGYELSFREDGLPNHPAKARLQAGTHASMRMTHLAAPGTRPAIELTEYPGGPGGDAAYELETDDEGPVAVTVAAAEDAGRSKDFWCDGAGFELRAPDRFDHPAVLPGWRLAVAIEPRAEGPATTVDAAGCVLVTLLSTDVAADRDRLSALTSSKRTTPVWTEQVAGRELEVAIVEGPRGELVELVALPRDNTTPEAR